MTAQMTNYSAEDVIAIAAIDEEHHIGVLTNCGISRDSARKIIAATDDMLRKGIEMGEANIAAKANASIAAAVAASRREMIIRNA